MVVCEFVGGIARARCQEPADFVVIRGRIPMHHAARCVEHARRARELGHTLRAIMPGECQHGQINPLVRAEDDR
jgi:hypothetical protein